MKFASLRQLIFAILEGVAVAGIAVEVVKHDMIGAAIAVGLFVIFRLEGLTP